jgi:zinc transporter, ZIP family
MNPAVTQAAQLVAFPVATAIIGTLIAVWKRVTDGVAGFIQHFAGGVVFAAVAGEVLPSLREQHSLRAVLIGSTVGVAVVVALGTYEKRIEERHGTTTGLPKALLGAIAIDLLIDGLLVGMGAAVGEGHGRTLMIALTIEVLFLGLSLTAELTDRNVPRRTAIATPILVSLTMIVGAVGGAAVLGERHMLCLPGFSHLVPQLCFTSSPRNFSLKHPTTTGISLPFSSALSCSSHSGVSPFC